MEGQQVHVAGDMMMAVNNDRRPRNPVVGIKSAGPLVSTIVARINATVGLSQESPVSKLVESLVWPFVCKRMGTRESAFSNIEFERFVRSMTHTAKQLLAFDTPDSKNQSFIKYWTALFFCKVAKDDQRPVKEDWFVKDGRVLPLFSGWCLNFVKRAIARRDVCFVYSLLKGSKQMWPELGEEKRLAALKKHAERFSTLHGALPVDLHMEVLRTSRQVFSEPREQTKFLPSTSACLQASVRKGGALSLFADYDLKASVRGETARQLGKLRAIALDLDQWRAENHHQAYGKACERLERYDGTETFELIGRNGKPINGSSVTFQVPEALKLQVIAIPEPGKYRIITKGDGYLYSALQPLQGEMLSRWKRHPASTMLHDDLLDQVREIDEAIPGMMWCSVDYEAATDLLKKFATEVAMEGLQGHQFYELGCASLGNGRAYYADDLFGEGTKTVVPAVDGQPMGHPLSFPLLCVINLAVYRCALDRWVYRVHGSEGRRRRALRNQLRRRVLVNGDDMLFKCEESFYPVFLAAATEAGLKVSQGKQYLSPDVCMINSQVYQRNAGRMERKGYLNLKLVKGVNVKSGDSLATPTQVGKELGRMCDHCSWASVAIPEAMSRWDNKHMKGGKRWLGEHYYPNWGMPVHLGGMGVPRQYLNDLKVTRAQRVMAERFVQNPKMALYRMEGNHIDLGSLDLLGSMAKWKMIPGSYVPNRHELIENDGWLNRIAFASQAAYGTSHAIADALAIRPQTFGSTWGVRPMSDNRLELFWEAQVYATGSLPDCPSVEPIREIPLRARYRSFGIRSTSTQRV
jgi:hypothetical protein